LAASTVLIDVLKRALRARHVTYANIADHLKLSEANIKDMFARRRFTLDRIDKICALIDMDLLDLMHLHEAELHRISYLTWDQEQELVSDIKLLLVAACVRDHLSFQEILALYAISEAEAIRCLARLDKLGLIDLLPGNRIKLKIKEDFRWLANGPIEQFFQKKALNEFLSSEFVHAGELRSFSSGMLTNASQELLLQKIEALIKEFANIHRNDCDKPGKKRKNLGLFVALRPWRLEAFNRLKYE